MQNRSLNVYNRVFNRLEIGKVIYGPCAAHDFVFERSASTTTRHHDNAVAMKILHHVILEICGALVTDIWIFRAAAHFEAKSPASG